MSWARVVNFGLRFRWETENSDLYAFLKLIENLKNLKSGVVLFFQLDGHEKNIYFGG